MLTRCVSSNQNRPSAWTSARKRISDFLSADVIANPPGPAATEDGSPGPPLAVGVVRAPSGSAPFAVGPEGAGTSTAVAEGTVPVAAGAGSGGSVFGGRGFC